MLLRLLAGLLVHSVSEEQGYIQKAKRKQFVLGVLSRLYFDDESGIVSFNELFKKFCLLESLSAAEFGCLLDELVADGFVQRIDGGNKEKPQVEVSYAITPNGLNSIGYVEKT